MAGRSVVTSPVRFLMSCFDQEAQVWTATCAIILAALIVQIVEWDGRTQLHAKEWEVFGESK